MRRELRFGAKAIRRRPLVELLAWSVPETLPTAISGLVIAKAVDAGFLAGEPLVGLAWLSAMFLAGGIGAIGAKGVFRRLGDIVEDFRDDLVTRVVAGALSPHTVGADGAVARLTRQVETVRDTYAGLILLTRGFVVTVVGVVLGLLTISPLIAAVVLPVFLLGLIAFLLTLGLAAATYRTAIAADEELGDVTTSVLRGITDVTATGGQRYAQAITTPAVDAQAAAERALARIAALRALCFALGGWVPLAVVLVLSPWLLERGLTAGAILGGLTYVLFGLQPALNGFMAGVGGSGLRFTITLGRILDATRSQSPVASRHVPDLSAPVDMVVTGLTFRYGPYAMPVLREFDLTVSEGDHLAIIGPSGIGKSTLANLLCGVLPADAGRVEIAGSDVSRTSPADLARLRVLIPQEAYVFTGTVHQNLTYLDPTVELSKLDHAVDQVGARELVASLDGYRGMVDPARLSAGQRQLLALVRAYLSPAPVAILDEATCHLDPTAERRAENAFARRAGTLVVIAHRISSARRAGRILLMDGDMPVVGDHDLLSSSSTLYRELIGQPATGHRPHDSPDGGAA